MEFSDGFVGLADFYPKLAKFMKTLGFWLNMSFFGGLVDSITNLQGEYVP